MDDNQGFLDSTRRFLSDERALAIVGETRSGRQAVEETAQLRPELALMDVTMPGMNGFEATRLIRTSSPPPSASRIWCR